METNNAESQKLILEHIDFAKKLAKKFYKHKFNLGLERDECESVAYLALCQAAIRFDLTRNVTFKTFCFSRIRGALVELMFQTVGESRWHYRSKIEKLEESTEQRDFLEEENLAITIPLDEAFPEDDKPHAEVIDFPWWRTGAPENLIARKEVHEHLKRALNKLTPDQREVIELHYFNDSTLSDSLPSKPDTTKSWISRLHKCGMKKLGKTLYTNREALLECYKEAA